MVAASMAISAMVAGGVAGDGARGAPDLWGVVIFKGLSCALLIDAGIVAGGRGALSRLINDYRPLNSDLTKRGY
jgi:hypothetical protein